MTEMFRNVNFGFDLPVLSASGYDSDGAMHCPGVLVQQVGDRCVRGVERHLDPVPRQCGWSTGANCRCPC